MTRHPLKTEFATIRGSSTRPESIAGIRLMPLCLALAGLLSGGAEAKSAAEQNGGWLAYADHRTSVGLGVDNEGELSAEVRHVLNATNTSGLIGEAWLQESAGGLKLSLNWIPADGEGRPDRANPIRKAFVAIDQNHLDDRKLSVGGGLENKDGFVAGYLSHALSGRRALTSTQETVTNTVNGFDNGRPFVDTIITTMATERYEQAFDWGVGIRAGRYLEDSQLRLALGLDHEWGGNDARQTTLSAEAEKFFAGSPWSVTLRGEVFSRDNVGQDQDDDGRAWLILRYSFGESARRPTTYPVAASVASPFASSFASSAAPSVASPSRPFDSKQATLPPASSASSASPASSASLASAAKGGATQTTPADTTVARGMDQGATVQAGAAGAAVPAMRTERRMVKTTASMLTDAFFKFDSAKLTQETVSELDQVIQLITGNGFSDRITLTGHTCDIGTEAYNDGLSQRRADSVKRYLTAKGKLPEDRIDAKGMGERAPKYPNTRAERYKNRRVDVEFLAFVDKEELVQIPVPVADIPPAAPAAVPAVPAAATMAAAASGSAPTSKTEPKTEPKTESKTKAEPMSAPAPATVGPDDKATARGPDQPPALIIRQEIVELEPAWIQYGLLNTIPHKRTVDTYRTEVTRTTESSSRAFVNRAPVAADDAFTVTGVAPMPLPVLSNDSDPDGDALHIESITQPASGNVSITGDSLTYTPAVGASNGNVQFSYTVNDGHGGVVTANVVLTLAQSQNPNPNPSLNHAPQAVDDAYRVSGIQSTPLDVLANDSDPDGDTLSILSFSQPSAGSLSLSGNALIFSPYAPFWTTNFTYTIDDGHGGTSSATVTLTDP